jgi:hypothetical protein
MKKCLCCGTESDAGALTCDNCGEGSWSGSVAVVVQPKEEPRPVIVAVKFVESGEPTNSVVSEVVSESVVIATDPDTSPEVPARRRNRNR